MQGTETQAHACDVAAGCTHRAAIKQPIQELTGSGSATKRRQYTESLRKNNRERLVAAKRAKYAGTEFVAAVTTPVATPVESVVDTFTVQQLQSQTLQQGTEPMTDTLAPQPQHSPPQLQSQQLQPQSQHTSWFSEDQVQQTLKLLALPTAHTKAQALRDITKMLSDQNEPPLQQAVDAGAVKYFIVCCLLFSG